MLLRTNRLGLTFVIGNLWVLATIILATASAVPADAAPITFEGQLDSTVITNQFPGFSFTNTIGRCR